MALVVFLPRPKIQYVFWAPCTKSSQIPVVTLVDFTIDRRQWEYVIDCRLLEENGRQKVGYFS